MPSARRIERRAQEEIAEQQMEEPEPEEDTACYVLFRHFDRTADAVRELKRAGCCVLAVEVSDSSMHVWDYPCCFPLALVFGNEALGVDPEVCGICDGIVSLPMFGAKTSVNVGNCAAAVLYSIIEKYEFRSPAE